MVIIDLVIAAKLTFILGITNIISLILVWFTCRCTLGRKLTNKLWNYEWYKKLYNLHCYFWWIFIGSVIIHAILAILVFGIPF